MKIILIIALILQLNYIKISGNGVTTLPILLQLNVTLSQDSLIKLIVNSASKDITLFKSYDVSDYQVSLEDLLILYRRKGFTNIDIEVMLGYFDMHFDDLKNLFVLYDFDYETMRILGFNPKNMYLLFSSVLFESAVNMPRIFDVLGLDEMEFSHTYLYGTEYELYKIFASANYSQKFLNEMIGIINMDQLFGFLNYNTTTSLFRQMEQIVGIDLLSLLCNLGVNEPDLAAFLSFFVTDLHDLEHKTAYSDLLHALEDAQHQDIIVTWISESNNLVTANSMLVELYVIGKEYLTLTALVNDTKIDLKPDSVFQLSNDVVAINVPNFVAPEPQFKVRNGYNRDDCYYYSKSEIINIPLELIPSYVKANRKFVISDIINKTNFVIGSPIICSDILMGVATEVATDHLHADIIFGIYKSMDFVHDSIKSDNNKQFDLNMKKDLSTTASFFRILDYIFTILKGFLLDSCSC